MEETQNNKNLCNNPRMPFFQHQQSRVQHTSGEELAFRLLLPFRFWIYFSDTLECISDNIQVPLQNQNPS